MDLTPHRQEIAHRLKALEAAIGRLVDSLAYSGHEGPPFRLMPDQDSG
jgi:hypothetical protein